MKNSQRNYNSLIKEICNEENIKVETFSDNWIFRLNKDSKYRHILGYRFELNTGTSEYICSDKAATYEILNSSGIPIVEHLFFMAPENLKYIESASNWDRMVALLEKNKKLVCKPNEGTGGKDVFFVENKIMLEEVVHKLFTTNRSISICPFYDIDIEYRVIVLDNEVKLVYKKIIQYVVGDGTSNILQLLANSDEKYNIASLGEYVKYYDIPLKGEMVRINWRHNLGQGATAEDIYDEETINKLSAMALEATKILNVRFASVDIIESKDNLKILEINSGVMMEYYSKINNSAYNKTKEIYREAIMKMFE